MLLDLMKGLADGSQTSRSLVAEALERSDSPAAAHVFIARHDRQAMAAAEASDVLRQGGLAQRLSGVPITVKANIDVAGYTTTAGSATLGEAVPKTVDAMVVGRLRRAGLVVLGQTNMTEFAFSGLGLNPHFGTPLNPRFSTPTIPGGSSAGAAVSVALGLCPAAIGTDTGGSVRIPAAMCGLVGFKPTAEAISRVGVAPLSQTLDAVGVIARSVADCALLFDVLRDLPVGRVARERTVRGLRVGVIANYVQGGIENTVAEAFDRALKRLAAAGALVEPLDIPELDGIQELTARGSFPAAEAYAVYQELIETQGPRIDPRVLARLNAGGTMAAKDYLRLQAGRGALIAAVSRRIAQVDVAVMPTVPVVAPAIAALAQNDAYHTINGLVLRNPTVVNLMDGCAISLPCETPGSAPVGLSLVMARGADDRLLGVAAAVEQTLAQV